MSLAKLEIYEMKHARTAIPVLFHCSFSLSSSRLGKLAFLSTALLLVTPGQARPEVLETFVVGCELYLFGKKVDLVERDGVRGISVRLNGVRVTINDIVYYDAEAVKAASSAHVELSEGGRRELDGIMKLGRVLEAIKAHDITVLGADSVSVDGTVIPTGVATPCSLEDGEVVRVTYYEDCFYVDVDGMSGLGHYKGYARPERRVQSDEVARDVYDSVVMDLRPGSLVSMGVSYRNRYMNPAVFPALRRAMAKIPSLAEYVTMVNGKPVYRPLTIDGFSFFTSEVRDFVEASGGGQ